MYLTWETKNLFQKAKKLACDILWKVKAEYRVNGNNNNIDCFRYN